MPFTRVNSAIPAAITSGPTVICSRGPIRAESAADRADKASMIAVSGSSAVPASSGL